MLMGEYHHNIDDKNRLIIPSKLRECLGDKLVITRGIDKCLFIFSASKWNSIIDKLSLIPFTNKDARDFTRFFLSGAAECLFDKSGRINIPSPLVKYAGISDKCTIIGVNDRIEVWDEANWNIFIESNENNLSEIAEGLLNGGTNEAL